MCCASQDLTCCDHFLYRKRGGGGLTLRWKIMTRVRVTCCCWSSPPPLHGPIAEGSLGLRTCFKDTNRCTVQAFQLSSGVVRHEMKLQKKKKKKIKEQWTRHELNVKNNFDSQPIFSYFAQLCILFHWHRTPLYILYCIQLLCFISEFISVYLETSTISYTWILSQSE